MLFIAIIPNGLLMYFGLKLIINYVLSMKYYLQFRIEHFQSSNDPFNV